MKYIPPVGEKISPNRENFLMRSTGLNTAEKKPIDESSRKNQLKKLVETFGSLKERRTFAPAIEKRRQVVER